MGLLSVGVHQLGGLIAAQPIGSWSAVRDKHSRRGHKRKLQLPVKHKAIFTVVVA